MNRYKCLKCGFVSDYQAFVDDYYFDEEADDEIAILKCPNCNNDDEEQIIDYD